MASRKVLYYEAISKDSAIFNEPSFQKQFSKPFDY